jgi:hypothetical protein
VPPTDVDALVELVAGVATCILGEVFLLDERGEIAHRLGLPNSTETSECQALTFLDQGNRWQKRVFTEEVQYVRTAAAATRIPFFLRSMSAVRLLEESWDFDTQCWSADMEVPTSGTLRSPDALAVFRMLLV